jgi:hypothetical protein
MTDGDTFWRAQPVIEQGFERFQPEAHGGTLARLRGDAALTADCNRRALAQLGEDDWLMRSFVRWNQAAEDWLGGRPGPGRQRHRDTDAPGARA